MSPHPRFKHLSYRPLSPGEVYIAKQYFGDSIEYSQVRIYNEGFYSGQGPREAVVPDGNIYFADASEVYHDDFSTQGVSVSDQALFVHEMTHVWQEQSYDVSGTKLNDPKMPYSYSSGGNIISSFQDLNLEQMGRFFQDLHKARNSVATSSGLSLEQLEAHLPKNFTDLELRKLLKKFADEQDEDGGQCFAAGTMIQMADGTEKPIEQIRIGDEVMSFNGPNGDLIASTVIQTFETPDQLVIDFHGVKVTPGHVYACADGQFRMLIDILEQDGAIVIADGSHIRARTGHEVGTDEDAIVMVGLEQDDGDTKFVPMRAGIIIGFEDGRAITMLEYMDNIGWRLEKEAKGFKVRDYLTRDTMGFAWHVSAFPFDPRLVAGEFAEYRQGRIRVAKGRPVFPEDREYNGVIPAQFVTTH